MTKLLLTKYGRIVTIVTNPERGFLKHKKTLPQTSLGFLVTFRVEKCPKYSPAVYGVNKNTIDISGIVVVECIGEGRGMRRPLVYCNNYLLHYSRALLVRTPQILLRNFNTHDTALYEFQMRTNFAPLLFLLTRFYCILYIPV